VKYETAHPLLYYKARKNPAVEPQRVTVSRRSSQQKAPLRKRTAETKSGILITPTHAFSERRATFWGCCCSCQCLRWISSRLCPLAALRTWTARGEQPGKGLELWLRSRVGATYTTYTAADRSRTSFSGFDFNITLYIDQLLAPLQQGKLLAALHPLSTARCLHMLM
jgi:hypothetical protein